MLTGLGLEPVHSVRVCPAGPGGPEAAARAARYEALDDTASAAGAVSVLLGHTLDDQAETVLLGLARGSGARSLAGMAARRGRYRRPLLAVRRAQTTAACAALRLEPWDDPQNHDPGYARARVRHQVMPALAAALGPGIAEALARSAGQLRADADALDALAQTEFKRLRGADGEFEADRLAGLPAAIRTRVLRTAATAAGLPGRGADRGSRRGPGRAGDRLARAALGRPARRRPRAAAVWQAALHCGVASRGRAAGRSARPGAGGRRAGRERGGRGWTRLTWAQTSRMC